MRCLYLVLVVIGLSFFPGCHKFAQSGNSYDKPGPCVYSPAKVHIIGLTSLKRIPGAGSSSVISAYVSLHDSFDSSIKAPGVFRLELYEYVPRSTKPKGKRLYEWDDIDLNDAEINNDYWEDFLRAYNFQVEVGIDPDVPATYILQVTYITPGKRLTDTFYLNARKD